MVRSFWPHEFWVSGVEQNYSSVAGTSHLEDWQGITNEDKKAMLVVAKKSDFFKPREHLSSW